MSELCSIFFEPISAKRGGFIFTEHLENKPDPVLLIFCCNS